ncbi:transcription factor lhw [Quercus suber]|uniref:Transcription factor lhw n=1 Tax=Quercus suber TaxID=58331 RepID=A0AAW0LIT9_QUESU
MGSVVKQTLKSLCCSEGWSYGIFWRFVQNDSLLLTFEDAYYEKQVEAVIDMLPQVHMMGEGLIGQAAFTGKHRWMFSDAHGEKWDSIDSFECQDIFQDDSGFLRQFSSGIKTIAVISVAPQGVVQFGSTQKVSERKEFLDQTKRLFQEMENIDELIPLENAFSSLNNDICDLNGLFGTLIPSGNSHNGDLNAMLGDGSKELTGEACSATFVNESCHSISGIHDDERMTPLLRDLGHPNNQLPKVGTEAQILLSDTLNSQFQKAFLQATSSVSTRSSADSILTSFEPLLVSETRIQDSPNMITSKANALESCRNTASNFCLLDDLAQWFSPSPEHRINEMASASSNDLQQSMGVTSASSCLIGDDVFSDFPIKRLGNSVQSCITTTLNSEGQENSTIMPGAENDLFDGLGMDFGCGQSMECWEDFIMPVVSAATDTRMSECVSELDVGSMAGPRKGLFSELGLQELLDGISSSNSFTKSSFEDQLSGSKRSRMDTSSVNSNQLQLASLACSSGSMNIMQPVCNLEKKNNVPKKEFLPKSQVGLWIDDSYSINVGNTGLARPQKPEEPTKASKKRARPGESTRPRPKDRQQIQDRIKELRGIIPHGGKCSIDSLLDRTIKYMLFLQSVTKYADKLKQSDEPKLMGQETGVVLKDNSMGDGGGGVTWAFEVGGQTMVCPIIIEDHNPPGQMLIEMLCEEQGFFLEITDVIRSFGLNILKGVMEARDSKIWARFVVEANSQVTRMDIFWSLVHLLKQTTTTGNDTTDQPGDAINGGVPQLDSYQKPTLPPPISMAETLG